MLLAQVLIVHAKISRDYITKKDYKNNMNIRKTCMYVLEK